MNHSKMIAQGILIETFLYNPSEEIYSLIEDKRLARSLMNRDSVSHLYFLYKNGYLTYLPLVLCAAVREKRMDMVRELIDSCDDFGNIVEVAAEMGDIIFTYELIGRSSIINKDIVFAAIQGAARGGHFDFTEKIASYSYQIPDNSRIKIGKECAGLIDGLTNINYYNVAEGGNLEILKAIKEDIDWTSIAVNSVKGGHINVVSYALEKGANPQEIIQEAIFHYRMDIVHLLEKYNIDWDQTLYLAKESAFKDIVDYVKDKIITKHPPIINGRSKRLSAH